MKKILGLDIGSNSIGWALIENNFNERKGKILGMGSRIIPIETELLKNFEQGLSASKAAERRAARQIRRLRHRYKLRRERLIKVFKQLGWFPQNFPEKFDSLEQFNINDLVPFSEETINEAKQIFKVEKLPVDWAIYYLRDKALKQKITLNELARVIYHFNQRRGFKSTRKEKSDSESIEEIDNKKVFLEYIRVESITDTGETSRGKKVFLLNGKSPDGKIYTGKLFRKEIPSDWINNTIQLEIAETQTRNGETKVEFRKPDLTDWKKQLTALEKEIKSSGLYVGQYHFYNLIADPNYRIKEKVVSRNFYQEELEAIWKKQSEFYPELNDRSKLEDVAKLLYPHNIQKQQELLKGDLLNIIENDIIYYQRPLKSQKKLIAGCRFEKKNYVDIYGNRPGYKVAPKSSPLYQEFRIWQDIHNLRVFQKEFKTPDGKYLFDIEQTDILLNTENKEKLFELFDNNAKIKVDDILSTLSDSNFKVSKDTHRINFPEDKEFPGNETKHKFRQAFKKFYYTEEGEKILNDPDKFFELWHIFYSLEDELVIKNVLIKKFGFSNELASYISSLPSFKKDYAAYSSKALKKLLPLMRCGKYWRPDEIHPETIERINKIISGELLPKFPENIQKIFKNGNFQSLNDFQGLPVYLATYVVYGLHSERENYEKFESPDEIDTNKLLPNNSLRNPVVEQVVRETLNLVKDVWKQYGQPDEIHIELARDLKNNSETRKKIADAMKQNEKDRRRIISILRNLKNANPYSENDIEKLRLWEETANIDAKLSMPKISDNPTEAEIQKYLLWGEQNHISPYTGKVIPLSKLFTNEYEVEHIIPKSRFFDDSFANKTICEAAVNKYKDQRTAFEFISELGGTTVPDTNIRILTMDEFRQHINLTFKGKKKNYFLRQSIPDNFINRQINETRYINRKLGQLLFPIAKESIVFTSGQITAALKSEWGLNRVWKELLLPRFERLEKILGQQIIIRDETNNDIHFNIDCDKKRIDHRHHALDALVIAATTREHIRYLNSLNAADKDEIQQIRYKLVKKGIREFHLPWLTFTKEAKEKLQGVIVSYKNRMRIVQKGYNKYQKWVYENGKWVKKFVTQDRSKLYSIRKSLFKEPLGVINLATYKDVRVNEAIKIQFEYLTNYKDSLQPRIANKNLRNQVNQLIKNCSFDLKETLDYIKSKPLKDENGKPLDRITILKFEQYAGKRVQLDATFDETKIDKIPYSYHNPIVKILKEHLAEYNNSSKEAFTGEGLEKLYKKIGFPIRKVTRFEDIGNKLNFKGKLFETDKGGNVFFIIYENIHDPTDRIITAESSISVLDAVQAFIEGKKKNDLGEYKPGYRKIILSPLDLVYVPDDGEVIESIDWSNTDKLSNKIYKVVSFSKGSIFFVPHFVAKPIVETKELGSNNKAERDWTGKMIKERCIKLVVDRLGNIKPE